MQNRQVSETEPKCGNTAMPEFLSGSDRDKHTLW